MRKVLILTDFYYPKPSANGICIKKIADELIKRGSEVHIIAYKIGDMKSQEVIDGSYVHRIVAPVFYQIREKSKGMGISRLIFNVSRAIRMIRIIIFRKTYPNIYPGFTKKYQYLAEKILHDYEIDRVVAEYIPIEAICASLSLKRNNDVKVCTYVVDTFTQCLNAQKYKFVMTASKKWEKKIISGSDRYLFLDSFNDYYSQKVFAQFRGKMQGVGLPLVENKITKRKHSNMDVTVLYAGSWGGERNPEKLLMAFADCSNKIKIKFVYCGRDNPTIYKMQKKFDFVYNLGYKSPEDLMEVYSKTDILINLGNSTDMLPSKLFSYISTGIPIIHLFLNENDPCLEIMSNYSVFRAIDFKDVNAEMVYNILMDLLNKRATYSEIKNNFAKYTPEYIVDEMLL